MGNLLSAVWNNFWNVKYSPIANFSEKPKHSQKSKLSLSNISELSESQSTQNQDSGYSDCTTDDLQSLSLDRSSSIQIIHSHVSFADSAVIDTLTDEEKYKYKYLYDKLESGGLVSHCIEPNKNNVALSTQSSSNDETEHNIVQKDTAVNTTFCPKCKSASGNSSKKAESDISSIPSEVYQVDDFCQDMIKSMLQQSDKGTKVIIHNVSNNNKEANYLAEQLRSKFGCNAVPIKKLDPLRIICGLQYLTGIEKWADICLIIISPSWIRAIKNVQPTHETDKNTARYHYMLLQAYYADCSCINYKVIPVVLPGTDPSTYSDIVEIRDPYSLKHILENFESIADIKKWSKRGKELIAAKSGSC